MDGVELFQSLARNMRVDLRSRKIAMPQEHLDDSQIGAVIQQVSGERVP